MKELAEALAQGAEPRTKLIALVGNPNAGKTTLFNSLTGSSQKVGNYPGVTVERFSGNLRLPGGQAVECVDVPGLYSTQAVSEDEIVAMNSILGQGEPRPDLLVCVMDAGNLERNLFFYSQLAELGIPIVVALTMVDRLPSVSLELRKAELERALGAPVVPVVGHKEKGLDELRRALEKGLQAAKAPSIELGMPELLDAEAAKLQTALRSMDIRRTLGEARHELFEPGRELNAVLAKAPELASAFAESRAKLQEADLLKPALEPTIRYNWASKVSAIGIVKTKPSKKLTLTDRLDLILTHRVFGLIVFVGAMYLVFQSIYTFARPVMDGIQWAFDGIGGAIKPWLAQSPVLQSLVVDGLIKGVGSMLVFLPQILILFFFVGVMEGSGYLARAAFLMDRLLGWCGLSGRAFIPLLGSFACAIPGIMSARVMPDPKSRLATILVAPLMSCSARLPVYLLLIGAFVEPKYGPVWAGVALFGMHLVGLVVAIPIAMFLNAKLMKGKRLPFVLELPPYQWPRWKDVFRAMYVRGKVFVSTAGTIIVLMSVLIWALSYFPRSNRADAKYRQEIVAQSPSIDAARIEREVDKRRLQDSYLGRFGRACEPAFRPAGFDWRITTSILAAFPARETVAPSLGILFSLGGDEDVAKRDLGKALQNATWPDGKPLMTPWTATGLMVFFALCCQCMSTLATIRRETNSWKWPVFVFVYMTTLAYLGAVGVHQLGLWLGAR